MQKIGVFVCWCGSNIAGTVDVATVVEAVRQVPDVAFATDYTEKRTGSSRKQDRSGKQRTGSSTERTERSK